MPKDFKKRGRREEAKKRKRDEETINTNGISKRARGGGVTAEEDSNGFAVDGEAGDAYIGFVEDVQGDPSLLRQAGVDVKGGHEYDIQEGGDGNDTEEQPGQEFFGLLDPEEQEYFSRASGMLDANDFPSATDRALFVQSVFAEARGKELKIACSQSCSRLMERLIAAAGRGQVRRLMRAFKGHLVGLVCHRFASHVVEGLVVKAGKVVAGEVGEEEEEVDDVVVRKDENGDAEMEEGLQQDVEDDESVETSILDAVAELEPHLGYLLTERFASHTVRVFLLVLAGEPVDSASTSNIVASRKKEKAAKVSGAPLEGTTSTSARKPVPESFTVALAKMIKDSVSGLDNTYLRALATSPTGNPVLQLLLSLELTRFGKTKAKDENSVLHKLLPDEGLEEGTDSAIFIKGLLYDPVGSRLLETIVQHAPGKTFKTIYRNFFQERMGSVARNEIAGFVAIKILERLSKEDLELAVTSILAETQSLVDRSRLAVFKALIERCSVRKVDVRPIAEALKTAYGDDTAARLEKMLKFDTAAVDKTDEKPRGGPARSPEQLHGSLLAQTMLSVPGPLSKMIQESLLATSASTLVGMAKDPSASRVIQEALTSTNTTIQFRRKLIPTFFGHMSELAQDASGSHLADALWTATSDLTFMKERLAEELLADESTLRESFFGRAVWRNWSMDRYKRSKRDWLGQAKSSTSYVEPSAKGGEKKKSGIELARERFATRKQQQQRASAGKKSVATGANSV